MTKLAIIDLDGVIADSTKRFEKAEEVKQAFLQDKQVILGDSNAANELGKKTKQVYWQTAFTPELAALDTLIPGANDALCELDWTHELIVVLTSRPESMRQATLNWLTSHTIFGTQHKLIMKSPAAQYVKTVTWKALTVQMLASLFEASEVLFVDDEEANRQIVMDSYLDGSIELIVASSLAEALEKLKEE